jgi:plastocyanin
MNRLVGAIGIVMPAVIGWVTFAGAGTPAPTPPADTGTIMGTVRFTGTVPPPKKVMVSDGSTIEHRDLVVDPQTKGLRDVMALLEDAPAQPRVKDAKPVLVDQRDWVFIPRVVGVQHGQPVRFDNSDSVNHSVMAISTVKANQFNSVAGPGTPIVHVFEPQKPPVVIGCSLHPWMRAWVYVVPHPWFAVTDEQGRFRIAGVPPGKYTLLLAHPDTNRREQRTVEVRVGQTTAVTIEWNAVK